MPASWTYCGHIKMEWEGHVTSWLDDHGHQSDGLDRKQIWAGIRLDQYRQGCPQERELYSKIDIMHALGLSLSRISSQVKADL